MRTKKGEISLARWNKHYLIPRPTGIDPTDTTPISAFTAPDWVFVSEQGPMILSSPTRSVIGRYAYAIYDEGGLLDVNVAGYPPAPSSAPAQFGLKGFLSFADLTVTGLSNSAVNDLVGWRNYASARPDWKLRELYLQCHVRYQLLQFRLVEFQRLSRHRRCGLEWKDRPDVYVPANAYRV